MVVWSLNGIAKQLYLETVTSDDAWYLTDEESGIESTVFPSTSAKILGESPVTFACVGDGKLGYIGDVNAEEGSIMSFLQFVNFYCRFFNNIDATLSR